MLEQSKPAPPAAKVDEDAEIMNLLAMEKRGGGQEEEEEEAKEEQRTTPGN